MQLLPRNKNLLTPNLYDDSIKLFCIFTLSNKNSTGFALLAKIPPTLAAALITISGLFLSKYSKNSKNSKNLKKMIWEMSQLRKLFEFLESLMEAREAQCSHGRAGPGQGRASARPVPRHGQHSKNSRNSKNSKYSKNLKNSKYSKKNMKILNFQAVWRLEIWKTS